MTPYLYSGPMQSFELRVPDIEAGEGATRLQPVTCVPGQSVDLPDGHPVTVALDAAGFLQPVPAAAVEMPGETPARGRVRVTDTPKE